MIMEPVRKQSHDIQTMHNEKYYNKYNDKYDPYWR